MALFLSYWNFGIRYRIPVPGIPSLAGPESDAKIGIRLLMVPEPEFQISAFVMSVPTHREECGKPVIFVGEIGISSVVVKGKGKRAGKGAVGKGKGAHGRESGFHQTGHVV